MKKINLILILIFLILSACGNVGKILRNEKIKTTDEFLVKKKEPLVLPPDLNEIPEPGSLSDKNKKDIEENKIKKILKAPNKDITNNNDSSSVEGLIIDRIRK